METADEVARLAGECAVIRRAIALAGWVGSEGRALTRVGVLRKPAVPAACAAIGIRVPERFRSAADVLGLHRPWTAALALGVLAVARDRAVAGPELGGWPGEVDSTGRWLDALRAVCDDITGGAADASLGLLVLVLALLRSLSAGIGLSSREVIDAAQANADEGGLGLMQVHVLGGMSALSWSASAALTLAMLKGAGLTGSSSFQYSTGLSPLKDRQRGTASPGARRDEPVRVTS